MRKKGGYPAPVKEDDVMEDALMNDSYPPLVGKVKWFDPARRKGVIGTVGGGTYFFECGDGSNGLPALEPGALVTFSVPDARSLVTSVQPI